MTERIEQPTKTGRGSTPAIAQTVDFLRAWLGQSEVDSQIARAVRGRREWERVRADEGLERAEEWRRLNYRECTFYAREPGKPSVGLPSPFEEGVVPNIDPRIVRAAREGGPLAARDVERYVRSRAKSLGSPSRSASVVDKLIERDAVQTSALSRQEEVDRADAAASWRTAQ